MMTVRYRFFGIFLVGMMLISTAANAKAKAKEKVIQKRDYVTHRLIGKAPVIDGDLNDAAWKEGEWQTGFTQFQPYNGKKPTQKTDFKILYDNNDLYVAIRCYDTDPQKIVSRLTRRDNIDGDWAGISIDSYFDQRTAFGFLVSAAGVKLDGKFTNDGGNIDPTWNPVWYVKTSEDSKGWYAEMKIPFSQLRFASKDKMTWGIQIARYIFRNQEQVFWQPIPRDAPGFVSSYGYLTGLNNIKPKKEVALMPYVMNSLQTNPVDAADPFSKPRTFRATAGLDGKVAVSNDLTLNFTINPDFGQVEADPSEVNLSALELYFQERRPFFVEGSNIFSFPIAMGNGTTNNLFYSRRIGRSPHYYPDLTDNEYAKVPPAARILGAFKLSGKTQKGWSIGVMESLTSKEVATVDSLGKQWKQPVEPLTNYFNARVQKDMNNGNTILGGMVTATNRIIHDSTLLFLPKAAYTGGIDFQNYWKKKTLHFAATLLGSNVSGTKEAITDLQEAPQRYFQRPGSPRSVDSSLQVLSGSGASVLFEKIGGGHWYYGVRANMQSPGLSLNDQGFMQLADIIQHSAWVHYSIWEPFSIFRTFDVSSSEWAGWDFTGENTYSGQNIYLGMQFKNYWYFEMNIQHQGYELQRHELRGGPGLLTPPNMEYYFAFSSDSRKKLIFNMGYSYNLAAQGEKIAHYYDFGISYQPISNLKLSINPTINQVYKGLAYVDAISVGNREEYIVSDISQMQFSTNIRVNLSFTPNLSLEYWGQPFLFSANYSGFKKVIKAKQYNFASQFHKFTPGEISYDPTNEEYNVVDNNKSYSFSNPDFSVFNFRSNMVLRWEFVPGSTVYLVWSQNKSDSNSDGSFVFNRNLKKLEELRPTNIFLVKFSYRFSM
ncbi:MAG: carbohydrate binding family 9 domain-containing protein [Bacteroidales bacterium]|nr:carbohydrate binding family 9 domain-containing protein [Bacteroidales bacterium]